MNEYRNNQNKNPYSFLFKESKNVSPFYSLNDAVKPRHVRRFTKKLNTKYCTKLPLNCWSWLVLFPKNRSWLIAQSIMFKQALHFVPSQWNKAYYKYGVEVIEEKREKYRRKKGRYTQRNFPKSLLYFFIIFILFSLSLENVKSVEILRWYYFVLLDYCKIS